MVHKHSQCKMYSFSTHSEVLPFLKDIRQKESFDRLMNHIVGVAVHNNHDLNEFFPLPVKSLQPFHYARFKAPLSIFIEKDGKYYKGADGNGKCYSYRFKTSLQNFDLKFTDNPSPINGINYEHKPEAVSLALEALKGLTVATGTKHSKAIRTAKEANHYFNTFLTSTITPERIVKKSGIDFKEKTYLKKGVSVAIDTGIQTFIAEKVKASQMAGGYVFNAIRQRHLYCSISPTNGRLHNTFTSLSEALEPFIRLDCERIKGIDIANSQFLLLSHLLDTNSNLIKFIYDNGFQYEIFGKGNDFLQLGHCIETLQKITHNDKKGSDFTEFLNDCYNGKLYNKFAAKAGITRAQAKTVFFVILFGSDKTGEYAQMFKREYPSVFRIVNQFKRQTHYSMLSVFLQKIESLIFIESLLPLLHYSHIRCLTKHDSIYTTVSKFQKMDKVVKTFFDVIFNEKYTLKNG